MTKEDVYAHYAFKDDLKERFVALLNRRISLSYDDEIHIFDYKFIPAHDAFRVEYKVSGGHFNDVHSWGSVILHLSEVCEL